MKTKFALINTFDRLPHHLGSIVSFHRTMELAEKADKALQKAVKKANGQSSYLPTIIREVESSSKKWQNIHEGWCVD